MKIRSQDDKLIIIDFNEVEAYKIARKIEKDGMVFYEKVRESVNDPDIKEKVVFLIGEEQKHLAYFEEQLDRVRQTSEDAFEDDDLADYIDSGIFQADASHFAPIVEDAREALMVGLATEQRSILFYDACLLHVSEGSVREEIEHIIEEEQRHKALLESLCK